MGQTGGVQPQVPSVRVEQIPADALLVDVREDREWAVGHIEGARHVAMHRIAHQRFDPDERIYVICKVGARSAHVTAWLNQQGYDAHNVDGGMLAWAATGRPMTSDTGAPPRVL
jgi:rhodanese-related sulfurtransferase